MAVQPFNPDYSELAAQDEEEIEQASSLYDTTDMTKLVQEYMKEEVPKELKQHPIFKEFWAILGRTIKLTFLDKEDLDVFESYYDMARSDFIMSRPAYEFTFEDMQLLDQLRIYFIAAVKRAIGFYQNRYNERMILGSQIYQSISTQQTRESQPGGFLGRLKNFLSM